MLRQSQCPYVWSAFLSCVLYACRQGECRPFTHSCPPLPPPHTHTSPMKARGLFDGPHARPEQLAASREWVEGAARAKRDHCAFNFFFFLWLGLKELLAQNGITVRSFFNYFFIVRLNCCSRKMGSLCVHFFGRWGGGGSIVLFGVNCVIWGQEKRGFHLIYDPNNTSDLKKTN
ncbi:hypothetical protein T492DRAFT_397335 [Pavlovales sp. CCMP2436]|nr:hypothetical protein T492DRAFT_397335 [Pavlovales sp. CCMP2436]